MVEASLDFQKQKLFDSYDAGRISFDLLHDCLNEINDIARKNKERILWEDGSNYSNSQR